MYDYYNEYTKATGNSDAQERWARQLTWEVARHAVGEEIVVYPLMEKHLGSKGLTLANHDRTEHQVRVNVFFADDSNSDTEAFSTSRIAFISSMVSRQARRNTGPC